MGKGNAGRNQRRFMKEVHLIFPFRGKKEKEYLKEFQAEMEEYLLEAPDSSYEELLEQIGTPKDVVECYFRSVESDYLLEHMRRTRCIRNAVLIIAAVVLIVAAYYTAWIYQGYMTL